MNQEHYYVTSVIWTGNKGTGTSGYTHYERSHTIKVAGKPDLKASSDRPFRGDHTKYNPEDLLLASLSSCHMLWYLHLCSDAGVIVTSYEDNAEGTMIQTAVGGHFTEVILHPVVVVTELSMMEKALHLHDEAHKNCFIANSVNFPVHHRPVCKVSND